MRISGDSVRVFPSRDPIDGLYTRQIAYSREKNLGVNIPTFTEWFEGSKVVCRNGRPLVVYHSGNSKIVAFDRLISSAGFWFSEDPYDVDDYGSHTTEAYLCIKNPAYFERTNGDDGLKAAIAAAEISGHDGLIVTSPEEGDVSGMYWPTNYVAFDPGQIKIVDGIY